MKRITVYWKLRVLGAIDSMAGNSLKSRIREVRKLTFHEAEGRPHVFIWRSIQICPDHGDFGSAKRSEASDATIQD